MNNLNIYPKLVDSNVKSIIDKKLYRSHIYKKEYYSFYFNIFLFISIISVISIILYFRYKGKTDLEKYNKEQEKKKYYIFTKLKQLDLHQQKIRNERITNLPDYHL